MKSILNIIFAFFVAVCTSSCTDENKIAAAIQDGNELNEGDPVPFVLGQNYPNPFNPSTTIQYSLSSQMHLRLKVYTEDWQEVTTLVDAVEGPGFYEVNFSPTDIPSGEYYYTLEALGITQIRRMRLVK